MVVGQCSMCFPEHIHICLQVANHDWRATQLAACIDEAVKGEGIMLTRPNESMPTQQRRIETLLQQISSNLEGAAVAEAAAAAAKKASQVEQPTAAKV